MRSIAPCRLLARASGSPPGASRLRQLTPIRLHLLHPAALWKALPVVGKQKAADEIRKRLRRKLFLLQARPLFPLNLGNCVRTLSGWRAGAGRAVSPQRLSPEPLESFLIFPSSMLDKKQKYGGRTDVRKGRCGGPPPGRRVPPDTIGEMIQGWWKAGQVRG